MVFEMREVDRLGRWRISNLNPVKDANFGNLNFQDIQQEIRQKKKGGHVSVFDVCSRDLVYIIEWDKENALRWI